MTRLKHLIKRVGGAADRVLPKRDGITVLIYHRVGGGTDSAVDLDPTVFDRQMAHLAEHHRVLSLDDAVAELASLYPTGWASTPSGPAASNHVEPGVVVTFDDGTADFTDVAVPLLERHRIPATLYVATDFVESQRAFPWGAPPASWGALADVVGTGLISIESHTHTHALLDRIAADDVAHELDRSIELIGEHIGTTPRHFAYPKAIPGSPHAETAVRRRFHSASLARSRVNQPGKTDVHRLWRTPIQRTDDTDLFALKAAGGMRIEGELRAIMAPIRLRRDRS